MTYLYGVIVKIRHDDFVFVVHCDKVRTCMRRERQVDVAFAVAGTNTDSCSFPFSLLKAAIMIKSDGYCDFL